MNRKDGIILVLVLVIVAFLFASTVQYYNSQLGERDSQIASLKSQLTGLQKPDLVTALGVSEKMSNYTYDENDPKTYNHLLIEGTIMWKYNTYCMTTVGYLSRVT